MPDEPPVLFLFPAPRSLTRSGAVLSPVPAEADVRTRVDPSVAEHPQGHRLTIDASGVEVVGHDDAGVFHGRQTIRQLLAGARGGLPHLVIEDHPDLAVRGYLLDVSRDRVPTMAELRKLIDRLAGLKINQLQLYTEHTVAFAGHEAVWKDASPLTFEELAELEAYAAEHFIDLVPCQNVFGHLHHWLTTPGYEDLAECPDGWDTPWGHRSEEPFSLNPGDPRSLELSEDLIGQLATHSGSKLFNIGCDETMDVGQGRSRERVEREGRAAVYADYLGKLCRAVASHGKTPMFWGDIVLGHPELIGQVPADAILLNWGYEAEQPWEKQSATFRDAGVRFYVCPGTSGWCTITGRGRNATENLRRGAEAAIAYGAEGFLNTDWGDHGHWQPAPVSLPGLVYGAGVSWNLAGNADTDRLPAAIAQCLVGDSTDGLGKLVWDLSNVYLTSEGTVFNATWWFQYLRSPDEAMTPVSRGDAQRAIAAFDQLSSALHAYRPCGEEASLVADELNWCVQIARWAAERTAEGIERGSFENTEEKASPGFARLVDRHRELWLRRCRPGGLGASVAKLQKPWTDAQQEARSPF